MANFFELRATFAVDNFSRTGTNSKDFSLDAIAIFPPISGCRLKKKKGHHLKISVENLFLVRSVFLVFVPI